MKVFIVEQVDPTICSCWPDGRTPHKVFKTLQKAKKFIKDNPQKWKRGSYFEITNEQGFEIG